MDEQIEKLKELQNKKDSYLRKAQAVQSRMDSLQEKDIVPKLREEYIGRCFVFDNTDGTNRWPLYRKVLDIESAWIVNGGKPMVRAKLFEFSIHKGWRDREFVVEIGNGTDFPLDSIGREIPVMEFRSAWVKLLDKVEKAYK